MRRIQRLILDRLSKDTKNPVLAELAREIAAGRLTARDALSINAYAEAAFTAGRDTFHRIAAMPDSERDELAEQAREALDEVDEPADEPSEPEAAVVTRPPRRRAEFDDEEPASSIMVSARTPRAAPGQPDPAVPDERSDGPIPAHLPRSVRERGGTGGRRR